MPNKVAARDRLPLHVILFLGFHEPTCITHKSLGMTKLIGVGNLALIGFKYRQYFVVYI